MPIKGTFWKEHAAGLVHLVTSSDEATGEVTTWSYTTSKFGDEVAGFSWIGNVHEFRGEFKFLSLGK